MSWFAALLSVISVGLYLYSAITVARAVAQRQPIQRASINLAVVVAWLSHTALIISHTIAAQSLNLGLSGVALLHSHLLALLALLVNAYRPVQGIYLLALPIAAVELSVGLLSLQSVQPTSMPLWLQGHILLSLLAYGVLSISALQALMVYWQERALKQHRRGLLAALPSLQTMESILFELLAIGWLLLTIAMTTGFVVLEDAFAQHVVHKTVFSLLSWCVLTTLLLGRYWRGWRGRRAVHSTLAAFVFLLLGFVGSQVVIELLLGSMP